MIIRCRYNEETHDGLKKLIGPLPVILSPREFKDKYCDGNTSSLTIVPHNATGMIATSYPFPLSEDTLIIDYHHMHSPGRVYVSKGNAPSNAVIVD